VLDSTVDEIVIRALTSKDEISRYCSSEWGNDYEMVEDCIKSQRTAKENIERNYKLEKSVLDFDIVEKSDYSYANTPRMKYYIMVNTDKMPSQEMLKQTAIHIWSSGNKNWKEFTVFMYLPDMEIGYNAYAISTFTPQGIKEFRINESALYRTKWFKYTEDYKKSEARKQYVKEKQEYAKDYSLSLDVKKIASRKIAITVNSNLPNNANLLISVGRIHYMKGEDGKYSGEIYSKDIALKQGKIETTVNVNDTKWYDEHQALVKASPEYFSPISKISDSIDIEVLFSPGRDQPKEILDILGNRGENIKGTQAESDYGMVMMRISKALEIPFKR